MTAVQGLWVSVTDTTDGATSSYGVSGAVGMVKFHGEWRAIGAASAFDDLKGTVALRNADQQVGLMPTLARTRSPPPSRSPTNCPARYEIHAVQSPQEIPGWTPRRSADP